MFRWNSISATANAIEGLMASDAWRAEQAASALRSLGHDDAVFIIDELLGWHSDLVGADPEIESALTRLVAAAVRGDFDVVAAAVKQAASMRRAVEHAIANGD
jgi:hypothetical protein